jgi:hypothetical protein
MGREIVYCEGCGQRLTEDDFDRGKAQDHDGRPFCSKCRPVTDAPPPPKSEGRATERRSANSSTARRRKATERIPFATAPAGPPPARPADDSGHRIALIVGVGLAVILLLLVVMMTNGGPETPPPAPPPPPIVGQKPPPEPRPPAVDPGEERLKELEEFVRSTSDPQAIVARCAERRADFRGTPQEARFRQIEAQARERLAARERAAELDRSIAAIRAIIQEDPACARRVEVEALIASALLGAGPHADELKRLQSEYRALCEEVAKRKAAEKPPEKPAEKPAPRSWVECFTLATKRIEAVDYPGAKPLYVEGLATLPETRPEDLRMRVLYFAGLYNLACIYAVESSKLTDKAKAEAQDSAFKYLDWALRSDYNRFRCPCHPQTGGIGHIADDKDMDPLRGDPRYAELIKKYK